MLRQAKESPIHHYPRELGQHGNRSLGSLYFCRDVAPSICRRRNICGCLQSLAEERVNRLVTLR
jgi:hypothetical protein